MAKPTHVVLADCRSAHFTLASVMTLALCAGACGKSAASNQGTGGASGSGGAVSSGGNYGSGGNSHGTGGTTSTGGAVITGGGVGAGGTISAGGVTGMGGTTSTGGVAGAGGITSTGGMSGRDAGRDLRVGMDGSDLDSAPVKQDTASSGSGGSGGGADAACGGSNQAPCLDADGKHVCNEGFVPTSPPDPSLGFYCAPCGGSGQRCCGSLGSYSCKSGMCNMTPPITCP